MVGDIAVIIFVVGLAGMIAWSVHIWSRAGNMRNRLADFAHPKLYRVKCQKCDGCGSLWMNNGVLQIIPKHMRMDSKPGVIGPPMANLEECKDCVGMCFVMTTRKPKRSDVQGTSVFR
jgi:hypothetical protein